MRGHSCAALALGSVVASSARQSCRRQSNRCFGSPAARCPPQSNHHHHHHHRQLQQRPLLLGRVVHNAGIRTERSKSSSSIKEKSKPNKHCATDKDKQVRLTKRMSQLDLCSRREADRLIMDGKVLVKGVQASVGMKVKGTETDICVAGGGPAAVCSAVVLNKPTGYVSGQPEHRNLPAVRLLTRANAVADVNDLFPNDDDDDENSNKTLTGFIPAGRLDKDSSGLLIFTHSGVVAKKLVSSFGIIPKQYTVTLERAHQPTTKERALGLEKLPPPTLDLKAIKKGGYTLLGDYKPLKDIRAKWIEPGEVLQLVLREGRKRQIRRICREILGFHVVSLERTKIGPVVLDDLPVGKWRPLTKQEVEQIISMN